MGGQWGCGQPKSILPMVWSTRELISKFLFISCIHAPLFGLSTLKSDFICLGCMRSEVDALANQKTVSCLFCLTCRCCSCFCWLTMSRLNLQFAESAHFFRPRPSFILSLFLMALSGCSWPRINAKKRSLPPELIN